MLSSRPELLYGAQPTSAVPHRHRRQYPAVSRANHGSTSSAGQPLVSIQPYFEMAHHSDFLFFPRQRTPSYLPASLLNRTDRKIQKTIPHPSYGILAPTGAEAGAALERLLGSGTVSSSIRALAVLCKDETALMEYCWLPPLS